MSQTKFGPMESLSVDVYVVIDADGKVGPFKSLEDARYFKYKLNNGFGTIYAETWMGTRALKALEHFEKTELKNKG